MTSGFRLTALVAALAGSVWAWSGGGTSTGAGAPAGQAASSPVSEADLWLAPARDPLSPTSVERAMALIAEGRTDEALPLLTAPVSDPIIAPYVRLHAGRAQLALNAHQPAMAAARAVIATTPAGYLGESALWLLAESLDRAGDWRESVGAWQALAGLATERPAAIQLRLAQAAEKAGDRALALEAWARIFFEWPTSAEAVDAETALARYPAIRTAGTVALELARAGRLYSARRWADARRAFAQVHGRTTGADRRLVELRLAQCDVHQQRYTSGLTALTEYVKTAEDGRHAEAAYFMLTALRGLKRAAYPTQVARFVRDYPDSPLAETALNDLATHYILADDDGRAAEVFTDMYARYPDGDFADRAAWRAGWWAYRQRNYRETIRLFESAATRLTRADYRPGWLYWAARSHAAIGQEADARLWYLRAIADYRNSYYGREATRAFEELTGTLPQAARVMEQRDPARAVTAGMRPPNAELVQRLLAAGLWDDAIGELRRVQGPPDSRPVVDATIAWALNRKGELRPAITSMRRAYPQFMSDGGEQLPERMLKVIFPIAHWETIRRHASSRTLDLYLVTALVAQESTFQADVTSSANAVGLMQLLPSTGRQYARKVGVAGFTPAALTNPDTNVRLGTAYLSDLLARYDGDAASALAAYNAGESRVDRWRAERPGVPRDEFVDDIPFPETQNYVKRILGTAEDYRLLYGASGASALAESR